MKIKKFFIGIFVVAIILISGCVDQNPTLENTIGKQSQNASTNLVTIKEFEFRPVAMTINSGETITFENDGMLDHSVKSTSGLFDSGPIKPGEKFNYEFDVKGTYEYGCGIHSNMVHRLVFVK